MSEESIKNSDGGEIKGTRTTQSNRSYNRYKKEEDMRIWGILVFGIIGATATTFAVGQLRRSVDWFHSQSFKGSSGGFSRSSFQDEARRRYARRVKEEYEEEMERVERIRRMQSVFNREKNKYRRGYERWRDDSYGEYHQHFQRDDWYWKTDSSYGNWSNFKDTTHTPANYSLSHHYAVLGLARSRPTPYTDDEIKTAFRSKAKQYHPDQNQENKEVAEARFKEIMTSYEAIKSERKNNIK
ncbi:hypothetical protein E3N88_10865 [Mikania micrantha]|uniref:J domain-containing protein n=1 Tax=Mikania micrantha TaxID=192012 RepID=A0A5N6PDV5_9ASTR|nr:hypothetical protein E3N88_10865 [Mikania micrantha]